MAFILPWYKGVTASYINCKLELNCEIACYLANYSYKWPVFCQESGHCLTWDNSGVDEEGVDKEFSFVEEESQDFSPTSSFYY